MGSANSRPKICQVAPSQSLLDDEQPSCQPTSTWMITATHSSPQQLMGHRQTCQLPPLKQNMPQIVHSLPGSQNLNAKAGNSIIKSHPPQQAKAWQPALLEPSMASDEHVSPARGWKDGDVHQYSTPCQRGRCGRGGNLERNMGGILQAQTVLTQQATMKRRAQQRRFKAKQGEMRRVYTSNIGRQGNEQIQRIRLVSRPTQRDIFWDESKGQSLNVRELLQPSPLLTDPDSVEEMTRKHQPDNGPKSGVKDRTRVSLVPGNSAGFSRDISTCVTDLDRDQASSLKTTGGMTRLKNLPWLQDFSGIQQNYINSQNILEGNWGQNKSPALHSRRRREEERNLITPELTNSVHQKWKD